MLQERVRIEPEHVCDRLFFALRPPPAARKSIACLRNALDLHGSTVAAGRLHVTLALLDYHPRVPRNVVDRMMAAAALIDAPGFDIRFDHVVSNGTNTCLRPGCKPAPLSALARALGAAMARVGLPMERGWPFSPHVTLGYGSGQHFSRTIAPIAWRADSIVLVHSYVGLTRHETLGEWRLTEQPMLL